METRGTQKLYRRVFDCFRELKLSNPLFFSEEFIRLVGLSATLPNYEDVATFLRVDTSSGLFYFDGSYRPCPLIQRFAGITHKKPIKQYQLRNKLCFEYCREQFKRANQIIVFVHSRKETVNTGNTICTRGFLFQ